MADESKTEQTQSGAGEAQKTQNDSAGQKFDNMVPKTVLNDYIERAKTAQAIAKANEEAASKARSDADALRQQLERKTAELEFKDKNFIFSEMARQSGLQDPRDLYGHVDLASMELKDGSLVGLQEKLEDLKKHKPYLFKSEQRAAAPATMPPATSGKAINIGSPESIRAQFTQAKSIDERRALQAQLASALRGS